MTIKNHYPLIFAILLFTIITMLDVLTTTIAINNGAFEANPLMAPIINNPLHILIIKFAAITVLGYIGYWMEMRKEGYGVICLSGGSIVTLLAVSNNFGVLLTLL